MSGDDCFLNPLQRDGTSQRQRLLKALRPSHVAVDERDLSDLLVYARDYARLLQYYSHTNSRSGDWVDFIEGDISVLVAMIKNIDHQNIRRNFDRQLKAINEAELLQKQEDYRELLEVIFHQAGVLERWYRDAVAGQALHANLHRLIGSVLSDTLQSCLAQLKRALDVGLIEERAGQALLKEIAGFSSLWMLDYVEADPLLFPSGSPTEETELDIAIAQIASAFNDVYDALVYLVNNAEGYLQETLDSYPQHQPHMALFIAFLQIFRYAQDHLNTVTARHLDFYYQEVLCLKHRAAIPDQVHLIFELAKSATSDKIAKDTYVRAGKDSGGANLFYATDNELVVNRAILDETHGLKTVYVDMDEESGVIKNIYAAADADTADGISAEIEDPQGKWLTFGGVIMPYARIGFAVASPMLFLAEGHRKISLTFHVTSTAALLKLGNSQAEIEMELDSKVRIYGTGEKDWLAVAVDSVEINDGSVSYHLSFDAQDGAIVAYDGKTHGAGYTSRFPLLRFDLLAVNAEDAGVNVYNYFLAMEVNGLEIEVSVGCDPDAVGIRGLVLENDNGMLDPAKPFLPFGAVPRVGSHLLIGSHEAFQKSLTRLKFDIKWADLPRVDFITHYQGYKNWNNEDIVKDNDYFNANLQVLEGGKWQPLAEGDNWQLFDAPGPDDDLPYQPTRQYNQPITTQSNAALPLFSRFDVSLRQGFISITLNHNFLHDLYPKVLAEGVTATPPVIPNPPYTPVMAAISLGYGAWESIDFSDQDKTPVEQIYQIGPFGQKKLLPLGDDDNMNLKLVPEFSLTVEKPGGSKQQEAAAGTLYLGIKQLVPPQNLSILFQVAEGSEDPKAQAQDVVWSYLTDQGWVDFDITEIIEDGTNDLLVSGVIKFAMQKTMTSAGGLLPASLYWIKASVHKDTSAVPQMIAIHPQATVASFRDQKNHPDHLAQPLKGETISKLKSRIAAIKSVSQPYASFGSQVREVDDSFYRRISERLRHKNRAVTIFDYERLVLEAFPEVYKVKCINHTSLDSEHAPGYVRLVVVPDLRNQNAVDLLKPRFSLNKKTQIKQYLSELASDFVRIAVTNPEYEEVKVSFNVQFRPGLDKGLYTAKLNQDIINYLSPWLYDEAADLSLGGRIHRSAILKYVEKRSYVDFITDFRMDHYTGSTWKLDVEEAKTCTTSSALTSATSHDINHDISSCDGFVRQRRCEIPASDSKSSETAVPIQAESGPVIARGKRYLGNSHSRELHDLYNTTPNCHIDDIGKGRRYMFNTEPEALAMGYDYCAYCFSKEVSKR